jgi:hypothetical protein
MAKKEGCTLLKTKVYFEPVARKKGCADRADTQQESAKSGGL